MPKRKKRVDVTATSDEPVNNPFASLAGLREQLSAQPSAHAEPQVAAPKAEPQGEPPDATFGPKVVVSREKKGRGGKTVTRVCGLGLTRAKLEELAKTMQRALGCGATLDGSDILLQGAQTERAKAKLLSLGARKVIIGN